MAISTCTLDKAVVEFPRWGLKGDLQLKVGALAYPEDGSTTACLVR